MVTDKLLENVVRQVINEYGGVSDTITEISSDIFYAILKEHRMYHRVIAKELPYYNGNAVYSKVFNLDCSFSKVVEKMCKKISVRLFFYDPNEVSFFDFMDFLGGHKVLENSFSPRNKEIRLTFPWPNSDEVGDEIRYEIEGTINHEVKHAYQRMMGRGSNKDAYFSATKEMDNISGMWENDDLSALKKLITYYIPSIYYNLTRSEVDAWLQELYTELRYTRDIKKCPTYERLLKTIGDYNSIKTWYYSEDSYYVKEGAKEYIDKTISRITTPREFFKTCDNNMAYLKSKLRRVIGRYQEETKTFNGSFKNYANGEIAQESPFQPRRRSRNFFRRLFGR